MAKRISLQVLINFLFLFSLAFILIFLQFHNRSSVIKLGDFTFFIKEIRENKQNFLSSIRLEGRTIELLFGRENTYLKEGSFEKPISLESFSTNKDSFLLSFENNISISFFLDKDKVLIISANNLPSPSASIKTPLSLIAKTLWAQNEEEINLIHLINQKRSLNFFLNEESLLNNFQGDYIFISDNPIKIGPFENKEITIIEEEVTEEEIPIVEEVPIVIEDSVSNFNFANFTEEKFEQEIISFRNKAYRGITNRFNKNSGTWTRNDNNIFIEKALLATLAEAISKNTYSSQLPLMRGAYNKHNSLASVKSALYLGDIINEDIKTREDKEQKISNLLKQPAINLTIQEEMAKDLFMYSSSSNFERILSLWENTNFLNQNWTALEISYFLLNYADSRYLTGRPISQNILDRIQDFLNQKAKVKEGRYYLEEDVEDIEASLKISSAILRLSQINSNNETLKKLKQNALAISIGILSIASDQGSWIQQNKTVYPEDVYEYISQNKYLPKVIVLSQSTRSWMLLASNPITQRINTNRYSFQLGFIPEYPEHLILSGVGYPELINFRGITWRTDPQFQTYTDGWGYLSRNQSLYLKISHSLGANVDLTVETES